MAVYPFLIVIVLFITIYIFDKYLIKKEYFENGEPPSDILKYYVIHMVGVEDRIANIKAQEEKIKQHIERFDAIIGKDIPDKKDLKAYDEKLVNNFSEEHIGEIGCYLSHYMLMKKISEDEKLKDGYSVIFEDDMNILDENLHTTVLGIIKDFEEIPKDFDFIYLGNLWVNNHDEQIKNSVYTIDKNQGIWGLQGYLIKNKNAGKIIENCQNMIYAIDNQIRVLFDQQKLNVFVVYPSIVDQTGQKSLIR